MSRVLRIVLIAAAMTGVLAAMVVLHAEARRSGSEIVLEMEPVDPRDILLGHYVQLVTPIHRIDTRDLPGPDTDWQAGDTIFVEVEPDALGNWQPISIHRGDA